MGFIRSIITVYISSEEGAIMQQNQQKDSSRVGFIYGFIAYGVWGFLPLYWKLLNEVAPFEILAHRIVWSFFYVMAILVFQRKGHELKETMSNKDTMVRIMISAGLVTINWGLFIWAVNSNYVIETSMGYYINPLIVILLGLLVLKERLSIWQIISLLFAAVGVLILTMQYGKIPWISLGLASSFALYGFSKKITKVSSLVGLALETMILMPFALGYILLRQGQGMGVIGIISIKTTILLLCSGVATATPLLWFAKATKRIPLSSMGFLQYISPTITLFLGVFIFKENFTKIHFISFGFIWCGLIVYSLSQIGLLKNIQSKTVKNDY